MIETCDVLVVGAGSAGSAVAWMMASAGRRVVLADRRSRRRAGARWVDGVPVWGFALSGVPPQGPRGRAFVVSPCGHPDVRVVLDASDLHQVDMRALVAWLQDAALRAGARWVQGRVGELVVRGGRLHEVALEQQGRTVARVRPALVVDASGVAAAVASRMPELAAGVAPPAPADRCQAAQAVFAVADPDGLRALLDTYGARPGDTIAIVGCAGAYSTTTVTTDAALTTVGVLTGTIAARSGSTGLAMLRDFVRRHRWVGRRQFGGHGTIPLTRPPARLGAAGVALVGDAARQVDTAHGSGVALGLAAARLLVAATAWRDDPGCDAALRAYARAFHRRWGLQLWLTDRFRRAVARLDGGELAAVLAAGIVPPAWLQAGLDQRPPSPLGACHPRALAAALRNPGLVARLLGA